MLQQGLELIFENLMKLLSPFILKIAFAQLFNTLDEKVQLLQNLFEDLNILVIDRFMQEIIEAESASYHQHQAFV